MQVQERFFNRRKQGNTDASSDWAVARLNLCAHLCIRMGCYNDDESYINLINKHFDGKWKDRVSDRVKLVPQIDWLNRSLLKDFAIDISRVALSQLC